MKRFPSVIDWSKRVEMLTEEDMANIAVERAYDRDFVRWLKLKQIIGAHEKGAPAFPVSDETGKIVGYHYRIPKDRTWRYYPKGTRTSPLVIGAIQTASANWIFESQWDALAVMGLLGWHKTDGLPGVCILVTRGAANGRLLTGLSDPGTMFYAFPQNDPPRDDGRQTPAELWLDSVAKSCGGLCHRVVTPSRYKDMNDWTRAGATNAGIEQAIADSHPVQVPAGPPGSQVAEGPTADDAPNDEPKPQPFFSDARPAAKGSTGKVNANNEHVDAPAAARAPYVSDGPEQSDLADALDHEPESKIHPFPLDALPASMAVVVNTVSKAERLPVALPAVCVLGAMSVAIGAGLEILNRHGRRTPANLYYVASGQSGSGKSETGRIVMAPVLTYQQRKMAEWDQDIRPMLESESAVLTREIADMEKSAAKCGDQAQRHELIARMGKAAARRDELIRRLGSPPCLVAQDVTVEKLAALLQANNEVMASYTADARKPLDNLLGRYSGTKSTDESLYLCAYSRDYVRVDRQGRGPVVLNKPTLTLLWFIQPDMMDTMLGEDSLSASGFLPRLLLCHTNASPRKIEGDSPGIPAAVTAQWENFIFSLLAAFHSSERPQQIQATAAAEQVIDDFHNTIVDRRKADLADVGPFAARYAEQVWRMCLTLHVGLHGVAASAHALEVETALNAIRIVEWFMGQQLEMLAKTRIQAQEKLEGEVLQLAERIRDTKGRAYITARDVHRKRIVPTPEAARALLVRMESDGLLVGKDTAPERGGRGTRIYRSVAGMTPVPA